MHYVYKYTFESEIIYIGKTDRPLSKRLNEHGRPFDNIPEYAWDEIRNSNISYITAVNSTMADVIESELIRRYKPKYNVAKMSEWSGINFVEPEWKPFRTKEQEEDLQDTINRLTRELETARNRKESLEKEIKLLEKEIKLLKDKMLVEYVPRKWFDSVISDRNRIYHEAIKKVHERFECKQEIQSGKTFKEILSEYKNGTLPIAYISICYNQYGEVICTKKIYTSQSILCYEFEQVNTGKSQGSIYDSPDDKTMNNWQKLRQWINRGSNIYYNLDSYEETE